MSLEIKNLSKKYTNSYIFQDFSYKFKETGLYLILGKSGSGKTTLIRLIAGLDKDFSGEISGGGHKNVSLAFQEYRLFESLSTMENVYLEKVEEKERALTILTALGLAEEDIAKSAGELSGGMKQRVSIARAIFKPSSVLCLDEPTKEIGKENIEKLINVVREEAKRRLVIIVTHTEEDFSELEYEKITLQ